MSNVIATWFYGEKKGEESEYPQVGGLSSTPEFYETYLKCVHVFFTSAALTNPEAELIFFTNLEKIPDLVGKKTLFVEHLQKLGVRIVQLELSKKLPKDWYGAWRNQMYIFDLLRWFKENEAKKNILILDSDCLITTNLAPLFKKIEVFDAICYDTTQACEYTLEKDINGISMKQMGDLYTEFYQESCPSITYYGGELVGLSTRILPQFLETFEVLWKNNYSLYQQKKDTKLNEEAHFLSMLYHRLGIGNQEANQYIKRMWTSKHFNNCNQKDSKLAIWHMPAEKNYGFSFLFDWLAKKEGKVEKDIWLKEAYRFLGFSTSLSDRMLNRTRRFIKRIELYHRRKK